MDTFFMDMMDEFSSILCLYEPVHSSIKRNVHSCSFVSIRIPVHSP